MEIQLRAHDQTSPVLAPANWIKISGIRDGLILRRVGQCGNVGAALDKYSIGWIVKKLVKRVHLASPEAYGGHSLRAGFLTEATVHRYAHEDQKDRQAAASKLGL